MSTLGKWIIDNLDVWNDCSSVNVNKYSSPRTAYDYARKLGLTPYFGM